MAKRYFTTTLPYLNADPHIGFAYELVLADSLARAARLVGDEVFLNTGTDEHGLKILRRAEAEGLAPQTFVDQWSKPFRDLLPALGVHPETNFIRTTDPAHQVAAQEFWRRAAAAGDIYKKTYQVKYCVGCELEKTESELEDDRCPIHPNLELETIDEENYFFRFSKYQERLFSLYDQQPDFVIPAARLGEIKSFAARGLQDFSISRLTARMSWGVPVPDDPTQTMYVWFDALVNYISALGWPKNEKNFEAWWPVTQLAGKDNLRQQAAMWPAMLLSIGLPPPRQIVIHGFVTSGGQKMSKSLGNIIDPFALVREYGTEAIRYVLLRHVHPFEDTDVTPEKIKEWYNANLANGLGNFVSRVMKMAVDNQIKFDEAEAKNLAATDELAQQHRTQTIALNFFDVQKAMDVIWRAISFADQLIQYEEPFKKIKTDRSVGERAIKELLARLWWIGVQLEPFMPTTAQTIQALVAKGQMPEKPLFLRK